MIVQVVANPLISLLGPSKTVHSRLTFAQAFNSLGTTIFPRVGSALILGGLAGVTAAQLSGAELDAYRTAETRMIVNTYLGLAAALAVIAGAVWLFRNRLNQQERTELLVLVTPHIVEPSNVAPRLPTGEPGTWEWNRHMRADTVNRTMPQQRRGGLLP